MSDKKKYPKDSELKLNQERAKAFQSGFRKKMKMDSNEKKKKKETKGY